MMPAHKTPTSVLSLSPPADLAGDRTRYLISQKSLYTKLHHTPSPLTSTFSVLYRLRNLGLDVEHGAQQVLNHLVLALFARILNLLDLLLGLLVCVLLGLLVSLRVLEWT